MTSVGSIVAGGFALIRDRPLSVAVWGVVYATVMWAIRLAILPQLATITTTLPGGPPDLAAFGSRMGMIVLLDLGIMVVNLLLGAAAFRAVLRPERSGFAAIRFGVEELLMLALGLLFAIGFGVALVVVTIGLVLLAVALATAAGGAVGLAIAEILSVLLVFGVFIFLWIRLSLAFPLTFYRRALAIGESWRLTRGHFWTLFLAYLVLWVMGFAIAMLVTLPMAQGYYLDLIRSGGSPESIQAAGARQLAEQARFGLPMLLSWISGAVGGAVSIALGGGGIATAARDLSELGREPDAAVFE